MYKFKNERVIWCLQMNKILRIGLFITVLFVLFWCGRIWSINQVEDDTVVYEMNQLIDCGDITIEAIDSFLLTVEEFENRFDLPEGTIWESADDEYVVGVCLDVTNITEAAIEWDDLFDFISFGFESKGWATASAPFLAPSVNTFYSESFEAGANQEIWLFATVSKICFKDSTWENIRSREFFYVLTLSPYKVEIRLAI